MINPHAGFKDVHDIVAGLLALVDHIHEYRAGLVAVNAVIDIVDILLAQGIAKGIDLLLHLYGLVDVEVFPAACKGGIHKGHGLLYKMVHLLAGLNLLRSKCNLLIAATAKRSGKIVEAVAHRLKFAYLTEHLTDLLLGVIGQMGIAYLTKVFADFIFHAVADLLIFLYAGINLVEGFVIIGLIKILDHTEHTLHADAEGDNFFLSLEY